MTDKYPNAAGFSERTTSEQAAIKIERSGRAQTVRERVLELFKSDFRGTTQQVADRLNVPYVTVQPRISELQAQGEIEHYMQVSGPYNTNVWSWKIVDPENPRWANTEDPFAKALKVLNEAAYKALRACRDVEKYPLADRQALRELCAKTDKLVDTGGKHGGA